MCYYVNLESNYKQWDRPRSRTKLSTLMRKLQGAYSVPAKAVRKSNGLDVVSRKAPTYRGHIPAPFGRAAHDYKQTKQIECWE